LKYLAYKKGKRRSRPSEGPVRQTCSWDKLLLREKDTRTKPCSIDFLSLDSRFIPGLFPACSGNLQLGHEGMADPEELKRFRSDEFVAFELVSEFLVARA
jgi:hypothetical protein